MAIDLVVATGNRGKLREIRELLNTLPVCLSSLDNHFSPVPDIPETGSTFEENALLKARWVHERIANRWVMADDSGLCVDALDGAPGIYSARYSGAGATDQTNIEKLLAHMAPFGEGERTARFVCVIACVNPRGESFVVRGTCEGTIGRGCAGTGGFGYDPLFFPRGRTCSFAQLAPEEKHRISHRGTALVRFKEQFYKVVNQ